MTTAVSMMNTDINPSMNGNMYVKCNGNHNSPISEEELDDSSRPKLLWHIKNREGYSPPALYHPRDVSFLCDNRLVIVEGFWPYSRIQVLDRSGKSLSSIAQGEILPFGLTVDNEGYIAVTDHKERTVKFFTPDGKVQLSWRPEMFDWPDGIVHTPAGHYIISDWTRGAISIHDITGTQIRQFRTLDNNTGYSCPAYITLDQRKRIVVSDMYDHSIKIFDQNGEFLSKFGRSTKDSQALIHDPRGVCMDRDGNIVVSDWGGKRVGLYSAEGRFIRHLLTAEDGLKYPWGIALDGQGHLLVSEHKLDKVPALKLFHLPQQHHN